MCIQCFNLSWVAILKNHKLASVNSTEISQFCAGKSKIKALADLAHPDFV